MPHKLAKFQHDPPSVSEAIPEKLMGGRIAPPPARARVKSAPAYEASNALEDLRRPLTLVAPPGLLFSLLYRPILSGL